MLSEIQIVEREFARRPPLADVDHLTPAAATPSHTPTPNRPVSWLHGMGWLLEAPSAAVLLGRG
jgi:hypothetical protein